MGVNGVMVMIVVMPVRMGVIMGVLRLKTAHACAEGIAQLTIRDV
jgi:hypothetical protein